MPIRHDLRTRMYLNGAWRDVTEQTLQTGPVTIEYTGSSTKSEVDIRPATSDFSIDNRSGDWSVRNPTSPWFGYLTRNVPVEHSLRLATDTASRTVVNGWGTADTGQPWGELSGIGLPVLFADWQVTPSGMTMSQPTVGGFRLACLNTESYLDVDLQVDFSIPFTDVTGGALEPGNLIMRYQPGSGVAYLARATIEADETIKLGFEHTLTGAIGSYITISGLAHTAGHVLRLRAQVEGQTLRAKVWPANGIEPLGWHLQRHDEQLQTAGYVGVRCGVSGSNTNALPVVFTYDNFRADSMRFSGEASEFPSASDETGRIKWVPVSAAGLLRRMGQQDPPTVSSIRRGILGTDVVAGLVDYWPCEDLEGSTSIANGLSGGFPMRIVGGPVDFEANTDFVASRALPNVKSSGWFGLVRGYTHTGKIQMRFLVSVPSGGMTDNTILGRFYSQRSPTGAFPGTSWDIVYRTGSGGMLSVEAYDSDDVHFLSVGPFTFDMDGKPCRLSLELTQSGGNVNWGLSSIRINGTVGGTSGTVVGRQIGPALEVHITPQNLITDCVVGHVTLQSTTDSLTALLPQLQGWVGERVSDRLQRLAIENNFPYQYFQSANSDTPTMGPQRPLTLPKLIVECVETDGGTMTESRGMMGLSMRHRASTYAQTPRLVLDVDAGQVMTPFKPVEDDALTVNDVTVESVRGSSARAVLETGRMSVLPYPDGINRTPGKFDVNLSNDADLISHANWRLSKGTVDAPTFPDLGISFDAPDVSYALKLQALDLRVDDIVSLTNLHKSGVYDDQSVISRGTIESWTNHLASVRITGAPAIPFDIATIDGDTRLDSGSTTLAVVLTPFVDDTYSGTVVNNWGPCDTGQVWTPDPVNIVDFDEAGGFGTVNIPAATNSRVALLNTVQVSDVDILVDFKLPITNITGGDVLPAGIIIRALSATDFVYCRVEVKTDESVQIGIRTIGGTVYAGQITVPGLTHTSAANISVRLRAEGPLVRGRAWATAGTEPTTWLTIAQSVPVVVGAIGLRTALGTGSTDAPMVISYNRFTASTIGGLTSGATSFDVEHGNIWDAWTLDAANYPIPAIVNGEEIAIGGVTGAGPIARQTFTSVSRGLNGATKSHAAGTPVNVLRPARLGL